MIKYLTLITEKKRLKMKVNKPKKAPASLIKKTSNMSIKEKADFLKGHKEKMKEKESKKKGHF